MAEFKWLTKESEKFLKSDYLKDGVEPLDRIKQICDEAEKRSGIEGFSDKFFEYMSYGWISLASPIWANYGLDRGLSISCFNVDVQDDTADIVRASAEVGMMSKVGGGTSGYFGKLRPRGSMISGGGKSNGTVSFMELFDSVTNIISQNGIRRGSFASYLPIEHGDIKEYLTLRDIGSPIQRMSFAVTVTDNWMQEMIDGDSEKRKLWAKVLQKRAESGFPYIMFTDNVNRNKPQVYKDKNIDINSSNLCFVGSDRVVSSRGYLTAEELFEQGGELELFDGERLVSSSDMKLREKNVPVYKVTLDNGLEHTVTHYHGMAKVDKKGNIIRTPLSDLKIGDYIAVQTKKGLFGNKSLIDEAFLLGLYQSDGTQHKDIIMLDIWENDFDIIDEIQEKFDSVHYKYNCDSYYTGSGYRSRKPAYFHDCVISNGDVKKKRLSSKTLKKALNFEKGYVPSWIWESDEKTQWSYIKGLLYADGTIYKSKTNGESIQISYSDINREFLKELQLLFNNLGLQSSIRLLRKGGGILLPDGKGGKKIYNNKDCYRLIVGNKNSALEIEKNTGFLSRKNIYLDDRDYRDNSKKQYQIISIEQMENQDVYCPTIYTEDHIFIVNGIKTFNCTEILLQSDETQSFVCCLSSVNLLYYDDWKNTDLVQTVMIFLDTVLDEFIEKASKIPFLEKTVNFTKNQRAVGLGVLGWHSYLQSKMIPFESFDAKMLNAEIFNHINEESLKISKQLAKEKGEPELLKGYGERFTTRIAIAPTTSSSFILGQVSPSIEPLASNYFIKDLAKGKFTYKNPYLKELLKQKDKDLQEVWDSILMKGGSVQHLTFLTDLEKSVFKTFGEISQLEIIQQAAQRQPFIDQGQSINLMIHAEVPVKEVNSLMIEAWKLGIKTLYYQRSVNSAQEVGRKLRECVSCQS